MFLITVNLTESILIDSFVVEATSQLDGSLAAREVGTAGEIILNLASDDPVYLTATPVIGSVWESGLAVTSGDRMFSPDVPTAPFWYEALQSGDTGNNLPTLPLVVGDTVIDNGITWECKGTLKQPITKGPFVPSRKYPVGVNFSWTLQQTLVSSPAATDEFGRSTSIARVTGDVMAVGSPRHDTGGGFSNAGKVDLYDLVSDVWVFRITITEPTGLYNHDFGSAVALNGDAGVLFVGCKNRDTPLSDGGYVYVYDIVGSIATLRNGLVPSNHSSSDNFGKACATDTTGNIVFISSNKGVYAFEYANSSWSETQTAIWSTLPSGINANTFAWALACNGDASILGIGHPEADYGGDTNTGVIEILELSGGSYVGRDVVTQNSPHVLFGRSVALNLAGDVAFGGRSNGGGMYSFIHDGTNWNSGNNITSPFGWGESCSLGGTDADILALGEPLDNSNKGKVTTYTGSI